MGRWAQRRRSGGGSSLAPPLIQMIEALNDGITLSIEYSGAVTAGDFDTAAFHVQPSDDQPDEIEQNGANGLNLNFSGDISGQTLLEYSGVTAGVLSPQAIGLTPI